MFVELTERTGVVFHVNVSHIVNIHSYELNGDYIAFVVLSTGKSISIKESVEEVLSLINK